MARTKLSKRGVITLPAEIRVAARLEEGDPIEVEIVDEGILLRPQKVIDASQAWYWTPEWQAGEREADAEIAAGGGRVFMSGEEFLASPVARTQHVQVASTVAAAGALPPKMAAQ